MVNKLQDRLFRRDLLHMAVLLAVAYWPLFYKLDAQPLNLWDESFTAVQAVEFQRSDNWWVPTLDHQPDHINTKPPLMSWLAAVGMQALGPTELAVRLPSALAGLATLLLVYGIGAWGMGRPLVGLAAAGVLLTAPAYVNYHITRTGDTDALLALWTTMACWCFFRWLQRPERWQPLVGVGLALALAVWTKSVQGLMILPGMAVYAAVAGRFRLLVGWRFALMAVGSLTLAFSYYLIRELYDPGYLALVARTELFSRFTAAYGGHGASPSYYLEEAIRSRMVPWVWLLPLALGLWAMGLRRREERLTDGWHAWPALSYLVLISVAQTKVDWYDAPLYPLLAVGVASLVIEPALRRLSQGVRGAAVGALALVLLLPYHQAIERACHADRPIQWFAVHYGSYFERLQDQRPDIRRVRVLQEGFIPTLYYYSERYRLEGQPLAIEVESVRPSQPVPDWPPGTLLLTVEPNIVPWVRMRYELELLHEWRSDIPHVHPFQTWRLVWRQ